jgi:hypothetical protein
VDMIQLIIIAFAAWYVAHNVVQESGPLNVFGRVRSWALKGKPNGAPKGSFAEVVTCIYCAAFWASAFIYAIWALTPAQPVVYVLAIAGGALAVDRWISS